METFRIIKTYKPKYKNPIILNIGEMVNLGDEEKEEKWKGWIWAENEKNKGWAPIQIFKIADDRKTGLVLENYSANELDAEKGDTIEKIKTLNGWVWARNTKNNNEGWIPEEIIG